MPVRPHAHPDHGFIHPRSSEITPREIHDRRRDWLRQLAAGAGGLALAALAAAGLALLWFGWRVYQQRAPEMADEL